VEVTGVGGDVRIAGDAILKIGDIVRRSGEEHFFNGDDEFGVGEIL
jgi:hypothetical protein